MKLAFRLVTAIVLVACTGTLYGQCCTPASPYYGVSSPIIAPRAYATQVVSPIPTYSVAPRYAATPASYSAPAVPPPPVISARAPVAYPVAGQSRYGYRPVVQLAPPRSTFVGAGLLGQPKAYVPGQPVRNLFRYFTP